MVNGDERVIEQVGKQLYKLIDVIKVLDLTEEEYVERELILIKVRVDKTTRTEIIQIANIFRARIVDMAPDSFIIESTGSSSKIKALEQALVPYRITEIVRTGRIAL